jgi:threonine dehydrogenase-like Zn-dependent dehydrogenase
VTDVLERYRAAADPLPETMLAWQVLGQGMENFGVNKAPLRVPLPRPGPGEVLLRVDAIGICFSDVKVIEQGSQHPRIFGRDLVKEPVVPGHECALTVVAVGAGMESQYRVGERFVIQADVYYHGKAITYGYVLWGGMAQYSLVGDPVLRGDEGSYLIPVGPGAGYAETALTEPWACVVHAYRLTQRRNLKPDGIAAAVGEYALGALQRAVHALPVGGRPARVISAESVQELADLLKRENIPGIDDLFLFAPSVADVEACEPLLAQGGVAAVGYTFGIDVRLGGTAAAVGKGAANVLKAYVDSLPEDERPARIIIVDSLAELESAVKASAPKGLDDIVLHNASPEEEDASAKFSSRVGTGWDVDDDLLTRPVSLDIGRVHYDSVQHLGCRGDDPMAAYSQGRDSALKAAGCAWIIGAAGPLGQMHVQRALQMPNGPAMILATDIDDRRIAILRDRCASLAAGKQLTILNSAGRSADAFAQRVSELTGGRGFDDIVVLAPVPAVTEQASTFLAPGGVLNIFAGVARGTMAKIDYGLICSGCRIYGSSGSRTRDLADTVRMAASGEISPNQSVAAIGGMSAMWDGVAAVKQGKVTGRVVIFPQIENFPLTELPELRFSLPSVHNLLGPGNTWTREAENELLRIALPKSRSEEATT